MYLRYAQIYPEPGYVRKREPYPSKNECYAYLNAEVSAVWVNSYLVGHH